MSLIEELIEELAPPSEAISVSLSGRTFTFRAIADRSELRRLQKGARRFAMVKPEQALNEVDRAAFDTDSETKALAYVLAETSLVPKLSPVELLRLAKRAGLAFEHLKDAVNQGHKRSLQAADEAEVDASKNASGGTPLDGSV